MDILSFVSNNLDGIISGAGLFIVLSAAIRSLPEPERPAKGFCQKFYLWFYNFSNAVLSNYDKLKKKE